MAYRALYRSYRPNSFDTVIGQQYIIKTLRNALISHKTSHAYIFSGPRGIGKTTIARILAKAINCDNPEKGEPCNKCSSCKLINNNETPDIVEFDAASNNGVDEIRGILEKVNFLPSVLKTKVYIIDEAHMLSISAFNALLKTLEEPPSHVMFVLATTEPHKIPATILSRCQRFDFKPLTVKEIKSNLAYIADKEKIDVEEAALDSIAEVSEGGMRDAIGILDQVNAYSNKTITAEDVNNVTGRISNQKLIELMTSLNEGDSSKSIRIVNELLDMGKEVSRLTQSLLQICRDILLYQNTNPEENPKIIFDDFSFKVLCNTMNKKKIFYYIDVLSDIQNKIRFSLSQKILLEVGIMKIANSTAEDYNSKNLNSENNTIEGVTVSADNQEVISSLDMRINRLKTELVKLNIGDFQEETKNKLNFLEDMISKAVGVSPTNNIEERIERLEERSGELSPTIVSGTNSNYEERLKNMEELIRNFEENPPTDEEKIKVIENNIISLQDKIEQLNNQEKAQIMFPIQNIETSGIEQNELNSLKIKIQTIVERLDDVSGKVKNGDSLTENEPTLFDFADPKTSDAYKELSDEIAALKNEYHEIYGKVQGLIKTSDNIQSSIDEMLLNNKTDIVLKTEQEPQIVKRNNPYNDKVDEIVETQRELEKQTKESVEKTKEKNIINDKISKQPEKVNEEKTPSIDENRSIFDYIINPIEIKENNDEIIEEKLKQEEQLAVVEEKLKQEEQPAVVEEKLEQEEQPAVVEEKLEQEEQPVVVEEEVEQEEQPAVVEEKLEQEEQLAVVEEKLEQEEQLAVVEEEVEQEEQPVVVEEKLEQEEQLAVVEEKTQQKEQVVAVEEKINNKPQRTLEQIIPQIKEEENEEQPVLPKTKSIPEPLIKEPIDEDNPYDIRKIELIMHDSRSELSRLDRKMIMNGWSHLGDRVGVSLSPIAKFLMDGIPVVYGNNSIIITYPNAALCNHVMGEKVYFEATQIIKITFGKAFNFIALPENIWQEKRNEYRGQYQMGTVYPRLSPINNPELKMFKKTFINEKNPAYNKALDLFGEKLIKEEEE